MAWVRRHMHSWDLTGITDRSHKSVVQGALNACDYPFSRIRRNTGKRVPATVSDLSRFMGAETVGASHAHVHEGGAHGHMLLEPEHRAVALGLYWLPTQEHPAGRVELEQSIMADTALAQEVFLAEAAHAVDYGVPLTDAQRNRILAVLHNEDQFTFHDDHGWFEERGGYDYWSDWGGENFMELFAGAFAPDLPRPLAQRQPWVHPNRPDMFPKVREIVLNP